MHPANFVGVSPLAEAADLLFQVTKLRVLSSLLCILCAARTHTQTTHNSEKSQNSEKSWNMEKSWKASYSEVKGKSKAQQVLNFNFIV